MTLEKMSMLEKTTSSLSRDRFLLAMLLRISYQKKTFTTTSKLSEFLDDFLCVFKFYSPTLWMLNTSETHHHSTHLY